MHSAGPAGIQADRFCNYAALLPAYSHKQEAKTWHTQTNIACELKPSSQKKNPAAPTAASTLSWGLEPSAQQKNPMTAPRVTSTLALCVMRHAALAATTDAGDGAGVGAAVGADVGAAVGAGVGAGVGDVSGRAHSSATVPLAVRQQHQRMLLPGGSVEHSETEPPQQHSPPEAVYGM